jgi:hypothetical protein
MIESTTCGTFWQLTSNSRLSLLSSGMVFYRGGFGPRFDKFQRLVDQIGQQRDRKRDQITVREQQIIRQLSQKPAFLIVLMGIKKMLNGHYLLPLPRPFDLSVITCQQYIQRSSLISGI